MPFKVAAEVGPSLHPPRFSLPGMEGSSVPPTSILGFALLSAISGKENSVLRVPPPRASISHPASFLIPQFSSEGKHSEALQLNLGLNAIFPAVLIHQHASNCYVWRGV